MFRYVLGRRRAVRPAGDQPPDGGGPGVPADRRLPRTHVAGRGEIHASGPEQIAEADDGAFWGETPSTAWARSPRCLLTCRFECGGSV